MRQRTPSFMALTVAVGIVGLLALTPFALGSPLTQQDATDQMATVNALVAERFTQTAEASGPVLTATAEAQATLFAQQAATQAAGIALTADAVFNMALTATAGGPEVIAPAASATPETTLGYRILLAPISASDDAVLAETVQTIARRLSALGVAGEATVVDNSLIQVDVVAPENLDELIMSITEAGLLEFVDFSGLMNEVPSLMNEVISTTFASERADGTVNPLTNEPFVTVLSGEDIASAQAVELEAGHGVQFAFTEAGGQTMSEFTRAHVGEPLAIIIDGDILSTPIIQGEFGTEGGLLAGNFSAEEASRLALQLNLGALPVGLEVVSTEALTVLPQSLAALPTVTATPGPTNTPAPTATPDLRPTATVSTIRVAEEVFEGGRMFYIEPLDQIWVMITTGEGEGMWSIYPDTFEEGQPEVDPSLVPPEGMFQPERGFGKLWRENAEVREALGWAVTPEFGYDSAYRYQPGGLVIDGNYTPQPGYHVLFSLQGEAFQFNEVDNTWEFHDED